MTWPVLGYAITTPFRKPGPKTQWSLGWHTGDDISGSGISGKPILNCVPGRVVTIDNTASYGHRIGVESVIDGLKIRTYYCHMQKRTTLTVGALVAHGDVLGAVGMTGNATGPHLHIEVRVAPFDFTPDCFIDPAIVLNWKPVRLCPTCSQVWPEPVTPTGPKLASYKPADFGPGKKGPQVTLLGERLVVHGFRHHYKVGPGPTWGDADKRAVRAFQLDQGWTGKDADGLPGPVTLRLLDAEPGPVARIRAATINVAAPHMRPTDSGSPYWVKGRLYEDRVPDLAKRVRRAGAQVVGTTESGTPPQVLALGKALGYATVHGGESDNLRLALHYDDMMLEYVSYQLVTTRGPNHNRALLVTLREKATGLVGVYAVAHLYHKSGAEFDTLRGQQSDDIGKALKAAPGDYRVILADLNSAIEDKNDKTTAALKKYGINDAEKLAPVKVGATINTAPGGKVVGRQIDRIGLDGLPIVTEWGVIADDDKTPDTDHGGLVYVAYTIRPIAQEAAA